MSEFDPLDHELSRLIDGLQPAPRQRLARSVGADLRKAKAQTIRANLTPDGQPMAPRKPRAGAKKRSAKATRMFQRAAGPRYLRAKVTPDEITVGYAGAAARILRVHQYGLRDRVSKEPNSPEVTYEARPLIGLTDADRQRVLAKVIGLLAID